MLKQIVCSFKYSLIFSRAGQGIGKFNYSLKFMEKLTTYSVMAWPFGILRIG